MQSDEHTPQLRREVTPFIADADLVAFVIDERAATRRAHNGAILAIGGWARDRRRAPRSGASSAACDLRPEHWQATISRSIR